MARGIDRTSFLTLTFGMAGLACSTGPSAAGGVVVEIPRQPPQPGDAGLAGPVVAKAEETPKLRAAAPPPEASDDDDDGDLGSPSDEGTAVAAAASCGWVDPATVARPQGVCSDDKGAAAACTVMKTCSGFAFPKTKCEAYRKYFKPRVAQRAVECLAKLTDKQVCDACNAYRCGDLALKGACGDPSADAACLQITVHCKAVSMTDCRTYLSGMNAAGRTKMVSCLTTSAGCGFGLFSCAEGLM